VTVVSVLALPVRADARDEFERAFHELGVFARSRESGGFLGGRLLRPLGDESSYVVVAEWESPEAYRGWLENPVRATLSARIEPLLAGEVVAGELFEDVEEAK
jgi:heme-degrading monooxygenase HmoA